MEQKWDNISYGICLLLIKENLHLREIAKRLNMPHSTVMRRLNILSKENIIDYRYEGKNKVFFIKKNLIARNYLQQAEQYKLALLLKTYPQMSIIIEDILKACKEKLIILFGSYANFGARKESDIDIYIETQKRKEKDSIEKIYSKINVKIGKFNTDSELIKEIIGNHIILRGVDEFYEKIKFFE